MNHMDHVTKFLLNFCNNLCLFKFEILQILQIPKKNFKKIFFLIIKILENTNVP